MTGWSWVLYGVCVLSVMLSVACLVSQRVAERLLPWWALVAAAMIVLLFGDGLWWRLP